MNHADLMKQELRLVEDVLPTLRWEPSDMVQDHDPTARAFLGLAPGWRMTVVSFNIESQGFPPGSRGYDGAAHHDTILIRLTRELAERAFKLADGAE
jgi:hypothetical protein